jgi:hypothetical protein
MILLVLFLLLVICLYALPVLALYNFAQGIFALCNKDIQKRGEAKHHFIIGVFSIFLFIALFIASQIILKRMIAAGDYL